MNRLRHWLIAKLGASCHCCRFTSSAGHSTNNPIFTGTRLFMSDGKTSAIFNTTTGAWDAQEEP